LLDELITCLISLALVLSEKIVPSCDPTNSPPTFRC